MQKQRQSKKDIIVDFYWSIHDLSNLKWKSWRCDFLDCYFNNASSQPPTAAPLIKDTPFAIIWNAPVDVCKNLKIGLDLSAFQAVTTPASVPNQFLFLFYTDRLGLYPYVDPATKQEYNGGIPQKAPLKASLKKATSDIAKYIPNSTPGLAVIDWESWRPLWVRNWDAKQIYRKLSIDSVLAQNSSLSTSMATNIAKERFQTAARDYMEDTIQLGIEQRPEQLWGFYLYPECYNFNWNFPDYTGNCPPTEEARNNELLWLWESSTALFPSAYLPLTLKDDPKAALFVRGVVKEAVRVSALPKKNYTSPIYTYFQPLFRDQNRVYLGQCVLTEDLVRTIGESAALGASGAVLWGASASFNSKESCEALSAYLLTTLNPHIANVTAAAKLCSTTLCQGNGRCIRKNPNSDDYLYLNSENFSIQKRRGKYVAVGTPTVTDLLNFADKFTCQCYTDLTCSAKLAISVRSRMVIEV
uniref:Hyaluronidase n=1 Tax=Astyanax mexicanus TaxID=7994 RepID=A0A8B9LTL5_ASTMX